MAGIRCAGSACACRCATPGDDHLSLHLFLLRPPGCPQHRNRRDQRERWVRVAALGSKIRIRAAYEAPRQVRAGSLLLDETAAAFGRGAAVWTQPEAGLWYPSACLCKLRSLISLPPLPPSPSPTRSLSASQSPTIASS